MFHTLSRHSSAVLVLLSISQVTSVSANSPRDTSSSTLICGSAGYDKVTPAAYLWTDNAALVGFTGCSTLCKAQPKTCQSFTYTATECLLYDSQLANNFNLVSNSPYTFYDVACPILATSTSISSSSSTDFSSSTSTSQPINAAVITSSSSSSADTASTSSSASSSPSSSDPASTSSSSSSDAVTDASAASSSDSSSSISSSATSSTSSDASSSASSAASSSASTSVSSSASSSDSNSGSSSASSTTSSATSSVSSSASSSASSSSASSSASSASSSTTSKATSASTGSSSSSTSSRSSSSVSSSTSAAAAAATGDVSIGATILIIAGSDSIASNSYLGLQGYGIPYEVLTVPSGGASLPTLNTSSTKGNYGGIVVHSDVAYEYPSGYSSALTTAQWQKLFDYQTTFSVRMVQIDVYPGDAYGTTTTDGCCDDGVEQLISFTDLTAFTQAGYKSGATVSSTNLWHYPATITNTKTTKRIAKFGSSTDGKFTTDSVAAVINKMPNGKGYREQMVWFTGFAPSWSASSNYLQHSWITWITRGLYVGNRRIHFATQIDDVELGTYLWEASDVTTFRSRAADLAAHVAWVKTLNAKLNSGSSYFIELGHNGNGNIQNATLTPLGTAGVLCYPNTYVQLNQPAFTGGLEFQKELGTGTSYWTTAAPNATYPWSLACSKIDPLLSWIVTNKDSFAHVSHTFSHESLNNATYYDTSKEISWNQAWFKTTGIDKAAKFSANGLIPPAITGTHNGDAIKAWLDNGIKYIVGDNTRPVLMNPENSFWPLTTTVAGNGYAGLEIIPRFATSIYFNCDVPKCTTDQWIAVGMGDEGETYSDLLTDARVVTSRYLLGLHHDPYMFHQANLRQIDMPTVTVNNVASKFSLLQAWVETVVVEVVRLVNWPIITLKHDDIAAKFIARRTRDKCVPKLTWIGNGKTITGATVSSASNTCSVPIPVTFPGPVKSNQGGTVEQVGKDPLTIWVTLAGSPVTFTLTTPITL